MLYGLFLPYHKTDIYGRCDALPDYPKEFRRYRLYNTRREQLDAFANTMCPASQMFECVENELENKLKELNDNFDNPVWLKENIEPYV